MFLQLDAGSKLGLVFGVILVGLSLVSLSAQAQTNTAQTNGATETPFIGFRPFDGGQQSVAGNSGAASSAAQAAAARATRIVAEQPASAYPYPASGRPVANGGSAYGTTSSNLNGTAERASLGGRLPSVLTPTGGLNAASSQTAGVIGNADAALWQRYQQEIKQQQAQQQYQQYQLWLAQQQQFFQQQQAASVGFRSQQASVSGRVNPATNINAQPTPANRQSATRPTRSKLNQAVVQQVSSTTTSNRNGSVARADWSSSVASSSSATAATTVGKQASAVANTVAKPQCCCVPQNCCVAAPATPAPVFRPQVANQVPTLSPNAAGGVPGGFLGQAGANYQVQPQGGYQFQPGLGVPQFNSTGSYGSGGNWFSNIVRGTGAYTPLLPIVSAQGARLGQGIIGQPTAYIDGQPIRNLLRYIAP